MIRPVGVVAAVFAVGCLVVAGLVAAVLTSCGSASGPEGYLYTAVDVNAGIKTAQFIQIVHNGSSVSGTSDAVLVLIGGSIGPQTYHYTVTGTDDGSHLALTLTSSQGPGTYSGTWQGNNLVLEWPQFDGSISTRTFVPGTIDQYNAAVKALVTS